MKFSMYSMALETFVPMLRTLSSLLDKGLAHAKEKNIDWSELANARLAPDMFPLSVQVQIACHHPQDWVARATGGEPPKIEAGPTDSSFEGLQAHIAKTIAHLQSIPESKFEGAEARQISMALNVPGMMLEMNAFQFLRDWSFTNFYFHCVTAYDILRHSGVVLGKKDFMSHIGYAIRRPST